MAAVGIAPGILDLPPAPTPRPALVSLAMGVCGGVDLYQVANVMFVISTIGYMCLDASRVAWPVQTINENVGSNITNGLFMLFALVVVTYCSLYFVVYSKWEREALEDAQREREARGEAAIAHDEEENDDHDIGHVGHDETSSMLGSDDGVHRRGKHASSVDAPPTNFAARLMSEGSVVARKARYCFFSHEGGMVNIFEIIAALIFLTGATMSFFAGIANVERIIQRRWDAACLTGDAIGAFIFFCDSCIFHHIYVRTLQPTPTRAGGIGGTITSGRVSCFQPNDPYFWSSVLNLVASGLYFCAATWGAVRQHHISSIDNVFPKTYYKNMLPMLQKLHALYLCGDVIYVFCACLLVFANARDQHADAAMLVADPDDDGPSALHTHSSLGFTVKG